VPFGIERTHAALVTSALGLGLEAMPAREHWRRRKTAIVRRIQNGSLSHFRAVGTIATVLDRVGISRMFLTEAELRRKTRCATSICVEDLS
jgi:hypothetical protein